MRKKSGVKVIFEPDAWDGGTRGLTPQAEFVYFTICKEIWRTGKPVNLSRISALTKGFPEVLAYVDELQDAGKIKVDKKLITNEKARETHKKALQKLSVDKNRTRAATRAKLKKALTPGKQREKAGMENTQNGQKTHPVSFVTQNSPQVFHNLSDRKQTRKRKHRNVNVTLNVTETTKKGKKGNVTEHGENATKTNTYGKWHETCNSLASSSTLGDNNSLGGAGGNGKLKPGDNPKRNEFEFSVTPDELRLSGADMDAARPYARGYDLHVLEQTWTQWNVNNNNKPQNLRRAFVGFVKKHALNNPL